MGDISSSRSASGLTDESKRRMAQRTVQCKNAVVIENKVRKLSNSIRILSEFSPVMLCMSMDDKANGIEAVAVEMESLYLDKRRY